MRPFIVVGDKTDHGGTVVEADPTTDTHGKRIARVGDKVTCPKRGHGPTTIVTGDPTMIIDGKAAARHGDKCACGATLIASQCVTFTDDASSSAQRKEASAISAAALAAQALAKSARDAAYDHHFQLVDQVTGEPLADRAYRLTFQGRAIIGRTDQTGHTQKVESNRADEVTIEVFPEGVTL